MFTALTLSLALGAPVPPPAAPIAAGTAPRILEIKPNADGKILVTITRTETQKVRVGGRVNAVGGAAPAVIEREVQVPKIMTVDLGEVKDLAITTADGKKLDKDEAMKKLARGGIVVVSGDGQPVSPVFLKVFRDDTLVLAAKELAGTSVQSGVTRPGIRPLPFQVQPGIQVIPAQPGGVGGVIQIQIQPGNIQVAPALPAAPVAPAVPVKPANPGK